VTGVFSVLGAGLVRTLARWYDLSKVRVFFPGLIPRKDKFVLRRALVFLFALSANAATIPVDNIAIRYLGSELLGGRILPGLRDNYFVVGSQISYPYNVVVTNFDKNGDLLSTSNFQIVAGEALMAATVDPKGNLWVAVTSITTLATAIAKIDPTGTYLLGAAPFGGHIGPASVIRALTSDAEGNLYAAGSTNQTDFPATSGSIQSLPSPNGRGLTPNYAFVAKLKPDEQNVYFITYATLLGGQQCSQDCGLLVVTGTVNTFANAIAVDATGVVTVAGSTSASDFPTTPGAFQTQCQCRGDNGSGFIARINASGAALVWSTFLGGSVLSFPTKSGLTALVLDPDGSPAVAGVTYATDFPTTPGALQVNAAASSSGFSQNGFLTKLSSTGSKLIFSTYFGGAIVDEPQTLRLDQHGNIWTSSYVPDRTGFSLPANTLTLGNSLIAEISPDGSALLFCEYLPSGAAGQDLALVPGGNLIAIGAQDILLLPRSAPSELSILGISDLVAPFVSPTIAPGEYLSVFGTGLGPASGVTMQLDSHHRIANELGSTKVYVDGVIAPLLYVSANQINLLVPYEIAGHDRVNMQIVSGDTVSQNLTLDVRESNPYVLYVLNPDGSLNSESNQAPRGSTISVYVSGAGALQVPVPDGTIAASVVLKPALPVQVIMYVFQPIAYSTNLPVSISDAIGEPVNLLRVDVQLPPDVQGGPLFGVQVGNAISLPFNISVQ
jgi:uncharacterized protein (TIGR03437 family)